jgi:hypothetical protein
VVCLNYKILDDPNLASFIVLRRGHSAGEFARIPIIVITIPQCIDGSAPQCKYSQFFILVKFKHISKVKALVE